jgi:hypothetical protein
MYVATQPIRGGLGSWESGDPVEVPKDVEKAWLDAGLIEVAPEPAAEPAPAVETPEEAPKGKKAGKAAPAAAPAAAPDA